MQILDAELSSSKLTEFVFSGGGVRGLWQWELYHLLKKHFQLNSFTGSSTGSLTALAAALDLPYDYMDGIYEDVCKNNASKIFKPGMGRLKNGKLEMKKVKLGWNVLFNAKDIQSAMKIDPLIDTIEQILSDYPDFKYKYYFYTVDLHTGSKYSLTPDDFDTRRELARGIAASCAIPGLVEPIRDLRTKKGVLKCCFDAGIRESFPLKQAFDGMLPEFDYQIIGLSCNTKELTPEENLGNIVDYLGAAAYNALNEMMLGDIESAQLVNALVRSDAETGNKKEVPITLFYYKGGRGTLEFTPEARLSMKQTAREDFERIKRSIDLIA